MTSKQEKSIRKAQRSLPIAKRGERVRPRRRMIIAFVEIESSQHRMLRQMVTGDTEVKRNRDALLRHDYDDEYSARYWCAADRPDAADGVSFAIKPVYRTHEVPENADCEVCGIAIRELQELMGTL